MIMPKHFRAPQSNLSLVCNLKCITDIEKSEQNSENTIVKTNPDVATFQVEIKPTQINKKTQFVGCKDKVMHFLAASNITLKINMSEHFYKFRMMFSC